MRFHAELVDVNTLQRVIQTIAKVSPRCYVRVNPVEIRFICTADGSDGGVQVWSQFTNEAFLKDPVVESKFNNQIDFEINSDLFAQSLRSCDHAMSVAIRLSKREGEPLLSMAIANASHTGGRLEVVQDIGVRIIRASEANKMRDPMVPDPQVHIYMPKMFKVRSVVEKMRNVTRHIYVSANRSEEFLMSVEEPEVRIESKWAKCGHPRIHNESQQTSAASASTSDLEADKTKHFRVKVDAKSLLKFLSSHILESRCIVCICQPLCVIFYVYVGDPKNTSGVVTFYLPGTEEDD
ncbi:cell cycle checkpoint [Jaminaea rosea]|uniref:Checkpoint protein n=1 Tax=Jaminaea rosea TaxID=1569628 RepID=A0A316V2Y2_9BASI|nr:cell cycle checkpoint [Jaminaea rosea]PWN30543.1 cell cycle checkpoint [Jaminaea rosea]